MVKIEAFVQPHRLDAIKAAIKHLSVEGVSYCHVMDYGGAMGLKASYRGAEYTVDTPRIKLEVLVHLYDSEDVISALSNAARGDELGDDDLIVVSEVTDALRFRRGRRIQLALT